MAAGVPETTSSPNDYSAPPSTVKSTARVCQSEGGLSQFSQLPPLLQPRTPAAVSGLSNVYTGLFCTNRSTIHSTRKGGLHLNL